MQVPQIKARKWDTMLVVEKIVKPWTKSVAPNKKATNSLSDKAYTKEERDALPRFVDIIPEAYAGVITKETGFFLSHTWSGVFAEQVELVIKYVQSCMLTIRAGPPRSRAHFHNSFPVGGTQGAAPVPSPLHTQVRERDDAQAALTGVCVDRPVLHEPGEAWVF